MAWNESSSLIWVSGLLVFLLIASLVVWNTARGVRGPSPIDSAIADLNDRFARGEITQAEFEERRRVLETYPLMP